jgi:hypothetical protein
MTSLLWIIIVVARLFRSENQFKFSGNRQLDSRLDRYCRHPHRSTPAWGGVSISALRQLNWPVEADDGFVLLNRNAICHPIN